MFLAQQRQKPGGGSRAEVGSVTLSGEEIAAYLEGEKRGLCLYAPGGYQWRPQTGQEILVLKAGDDGEMPCVVGARGEESPELAPGEVRIFAQEGGAIHVGAGVTVTGDLSLSGTLTVGGVTLQTLIADEVAKAVGS